MTGPRRTYAYPCPVCGATVHATAAYQVRHARPCLACTRRANGWEHAPDCPTRDDSHPGPCAGVPRSGAPGAGEEVSGSSR